MDEQSGHNSGARDRRALPAVDNRSACDERHIRPRHDRHQCRCEQERGDLSGHD
jgi:hypothetical protein